MADSAKVLVDHYKDREILTWTEFQVPKDLELDTEWSGYFEPLARAPGHAGSAWARFQNRPDTILLVTCKSSRAANLH